MLLLAAAVIIAVAVPLGTALTLDRGQSAPVAIAVPPAVTAAAVAPRPLSQAASLMLTGCLLIGLAAAVRRA